jgi:hypothetical protein
MRIQDFLKEVKKIFPNATIKSITNKGYLKTVFFCWCYGGISKNNYPDKYHKQIDKINKFALKVKI